MPRPSKSAAAPEPSAAPQYPAIDIVTRRIQTGDRNWLLPRDVPLVNQPEPMTTRVINTDISGRAHQVLEQLGWVRVEVAEVASGGMTGDMKADGRYVVMGDGGKEWLVKMPTRYVTAIRQAKEERLNRRATSKSALLGAVTAQMSEEARQAGGEHANHLERSADRLGAFQLDELHVTKESVAIGE